MANPNAGQGDLLMMFPVARRLLEEGEGAGNRSVGRPWKRWIDTVKDCLRKRSLDVRQARRMVRGFVRGKNACGVVERMNP